MSSHYADKRKTKAILITSLGAIVLILLFVGYMRSQKAEVIPEVVTIEKPGRKLSNAPSQFSVDPSLPNTTIYTSYRLGVRFSYPSLYEETYNQSSCPGGVANCPKITSTSVTEPPVEKDNSITFRKYRLEVFDKRSNETIEEAIARNIFPADDLTVCPVKVTVSNADKVVKAVITGAPDSEKCPERYRGYTNGRHFFTYPTYPNVLLFAEGPAGSQALFSHKNTWIGTIKISQ